MLNKFALDGCLQSRMQGARVETGRLVTWLLGVKVEKIYDLNQDDSSNSGNKWLNKRCILKINPRGFDNGMNVDYKTKEGK